MADPTSDPATPDPLDDAMADLMDRNIAASERLWPGPTERPDLRTAAAEHLAAWDDEDHTVDALATTAEALRSALAAEATEPPWIVIDDALTVESLPGGSPAAPGQSFLSSRMLDALPGARVWIVEASGSAPNPQGADEPPFDDIDHIRSAGSYEDERAAMAGALPVPRAPDEPGDDDPLMRRAEKLAGQLVGLERSRDAQTVWALADEVKRLRGSEAALRRAFDVAQQAGVELWAEVERLRAAAPASEDVRSLLARADERANPDEERMYADEDADLIQELATALRAGSPPPTPAPSVTDAALAVAGYRTAEPLGTYETVGPPGATWSVIPTSVQALPVPPGTAVEVRERQP